MNHSYVAWNQITFHTNWLVHWVIASQMLFIKIHKSNLNIMVLFFKNHMKKSSQEISVLHIEFPLHTILIIGGTILEIDWHISHFWPHYKIRNCQHYINGQFFRTMEWMLSMGLRYWSDNIWQGYSIKCGNISTEIKTGMIMIPVMVN